VKEIGYRRRRSSTVFPVSVTEATLAKQRDLREHRHNLQQGRLEKSKLAQHAYEEDYIVGWDDGRILEIERTAGIENTRNRPMWHV
jgi:hypothetical protein